MENIEILNSFFADNKIPAECIASSKSGCITSFDLKTRNSFKLSKLNSFANELQHIIKSYATPKFQFNFEKRLGELQFLTDKPTSSSLTDALNEFEIDNKENISCILGKSLMGEDITLDINKNPHLLIGGTTGSGKSALLHNLIANILSNSKSDLFIVDTKGIEFFEYSKLSNRVKILTVAKDFTALLKYLISIMERRYVFLRQCPDISLINNDYFNPITIVIDEYADLVLQDYKKENYELLCRLIQKCRAAGIYCILATQRPSANIITGVIKANFPARIACKVASKIDSRIILDQNGAETISNIGEAIISNYKYNLEKFTAAYSSQREILDYLNEKLETNL